MNRSPVRLSTVVAGLSWFFFCVLVATTPAPPTDATEIEPWDLMEAGFGANFRERVLNLSDDRWEVRERASAWLVRHREQWARVVPENWSPEEPEARWRWERAKELADELASLPLTLADRPADSVHWSARRLHRELGNSYVSALRECLGSPTVGTRRRAIEVLAGLPGIDLKRHLSLLEEDPAPSVRRVLYQVAESVDANWNDTLLKRAFRRDERDALAVEVVRAVRRQRFPGWRVLLRERWKLAGPELRAEIALTMASGATEDDRAVYFWMLKSERYPIVIASLGPLRRWAQTPDVPALVAALESAEPEVRRRLFEIITDRGTADLGWSLLPLLEAPDPDLTTFAVETLVQWDARDYYGDLDVLLRDHPQRSQLWPMVAKVQNVTIVPSPARTDRIGTTRAIRPGGSPRQ